MNAPKMLDLFSGAGGAAMGYQRAGFEVVGIDIHPQPDYPFAFVQGDATDIVQDSLHGCFHFKSNSRRCLGVFEAVHISCPCQGYTALTTGTNAGRTAQPRLVAQMREWADQTGLPYVIENVQGSDVRRDLTLCGEMFGLDVIRHRYFELGGWSMDRPEHIAHRGRVKGWRHGEYFDGPYFAVYGEGGGKGSVGDWQKAMGIDWTENRHSIAEAIPPAYTAHIGAQLLEHVRQSVAG